MLLHIQVPRGQKPNKKRHSKHGGWAGEAQAHAPQQWGRQERGVTGQGERTIGQVTSLLAGERAGGARGNQDMR